ncbi:MAG: protein TolR [Sphingorhabdus sp.]
MNLSSGGGGRRGRRRSSRRAPMAEINVTPLVDVMLVLLIIFMVTAPLLNTGVPVDLPESRANALDQKEDPVEIAIDKEGVIFVDGTEVRPSQLPARLEALAADQDAENPQQILLRGDRTINYGQMMRVMGELNRAGLNSVSLVTQGSSKAE